MKDRSNTRKSRALAAWFLPLTMALLLVAAAPADFVSDALSHAPDDSGILIVIPDMGTLNGEVMDFLSACGMDVEAEVQTGSLLELFGLIDVETVETSGANLDGGFVVFMSADFSSVGWACELTDPEAFRQMISAEAFAERQAAGTNYWVDAFEMPGQPPIVTGATAIVDGMALGTTGEAALLDALATSTLPSLASSIGSIDADSARIVIDLAGLIDANRMQIDQAFQMMTMMATMAPAQPGMDMGAIMNMYTEGGRVLIGMGEDTEAMVVTLSPNAEALTAECDLVFNEGSEYLNIISRHMEGDLDLRASLPADAAMALVTHFDNERDPALFANMATFFGEAMAGDDPETVASFQRLADLTTEAYSTAGDQMAFAFSPGEEFSLIPQTMVIMRSPDPAHTRDLLVEAFLDPASLVMMNTMYGGPSLDAELQVTVTDEGISTIAGYDVRQLALSGMGASMREMMQMNYGGTLPPELEQMLTQMDSVTYWYAASEDAVIITTESEPNMLRRILSGDLEGLSAPPFAQHIMQGVDAMGHLSIKGMLGFMSGSMAMSGMPPGMNPFGPIEEAFADGDDGIWGSLTMTGLGFNGAVVVPSSDIRRIVEAVEAMEQQHAQQW